MSFSFCSLFFSSLPCPLSLYSLAASPYFSQPLLRECHISAYQPLLCFPLTFLFSLSLSLFVYFLRIGHLGCFSSSFPPPSLITRFLLTLLFSLFPLADERRDKKRRKIERRVAAVEKESASAWCSCNLFQLVLFLHQRRVGATEKEGASGCAHPISFHFVRFYICLLGRKIECFVCLKLRHRYFF